MKLTPKFGCELGVPIRDNGAWDAMEPDYVTDVEPGHIRRGIGDFHWDESHHTGKSAYNNKHIIIP
jgi:hypothetical protein